MKKVFLSFFLFTLVTIFYAQNKVTPIQVLPGYTSMVMDVAEYEDAIYEGIIALSSDDDNQQINIFINKYIDTQYDSTISIDLPPEQFTTGEFRENISLYRHLKVFPIAKNEICVAVYSCFSNCHFSFFRIKDGNIISKKTYNLKDTGSYESNWYSFDGKDTIYFAYNGQDKFDETYWDYWIMSFDLDGNVKKYVKLYSADFDRISDLVAFPDRVFVSYVIGKYMNTEMRALVQLSSNLEVVNIYPFYCGKETPSSIYLSRHNDDLVMEYYVRTNDGNNLCYHTYLTPEGQFKETYLEKPLYQTDDETMYLSYCKYLSDARFILTGYYIRWGSFFGKEKSPILYDSYLYKDFKFISGYIFTDYCIYPPQYKFFTNGKIFLSGNYNVIKGWISKVAFHTVLENKLPDEDNVAFKFEQTDYKFFNSETYLSDTAELKQKWNESLFVKDWNVTEEDCQGSVEVIYLDWMTANPDDEGVLATVPMLPLSDR